MISLQQALRCCPRSSCTVQNASFSVLRFLTSSTNEKTPDQKEADARKAAKRKETHISLIHPDKSITHTTLEDATKLSTRRDLKLIKVADYDRKRDSPVYQLMTAAQYREEALNLKRTKKSADQKGPFKSEKLLLLSSKIGDHDLESKLTKIINWLAKSHEIKVTISGGMKDSDPAASESVFKKIETFIGNQGRILQKRSSGNDIKFQVIPPKQPPAHKQTVTSNHPESKTADRD